MARTLDCLHFQEESQLQRCPFDCAIVAVVVEGQRSDKMLLRNMVFQGTVLGPTIWNLFYEDAQRAIDEAGLEEIVYAERVQGVRTQCQRRLRHVRGQEVSNRAAQVGEANQVSFDPAKESVHIVSDAQPHGDSFQLLGVTFDCKLRIDLCVRETVSQASWKLTTILFHEVTRLVQVCKLKMLSFVEYRTPAVYHAASTILVGIDAIQKRFFRECCLT